MSGGSSHVMVVRLAMPGESSGRHRRLLWTPTLNCQQNRRVHTLERFRNAVVSAFQADRGRVRLKPDTTYHDT